MCALCSGICSVGVNVLDWMDISSHLTLGPLSAARRAPFAIAIAVNACQMRAIRRWLISLSHSRASLLNLQCSMAREHCVMIHSRRAARIYMQLPQPPVPYIKIYCYKRALAKFVYAKCGSQNTCRGNELMMCCNFGHFREANNNDPAVVAG